METKHTPGPWAMSLRDAGKIRIFATNSDLEYIAAVSEDSLLVGRKQNHLANAKLIAAAPELLEACKDALQILYQTREHRKINNMTGGNAIFESTISTVENAIKKATE